MAQYVDIQTLKEKIPIQVVLEYYDLAGDLKQTKQGLRGRCPFCEAKTAFTVRDNLYKCFKCDAKGSIIDFVMNKEFVNVREASLLLKKLFIGEKPKPALKQSPDEPLDPFFQTLWLYLEDNHAPEHIYEALGKIEDHLTTFEDLCH